MDLHAHWHETLAAFQTAAAKDVTTISGLHPSTETELALPGSLGGLIGSFWHNLVGGGKAVMWPMAMG